MTRRILAALAGQPNCGKSTVFNMLTGARQHVANYPGVTVEKKTGFFSHEALRVELVDLPGTYSLTSYSLEERVAREFLLRDRPQAVINVVDAANLKRSLSLTLQIMELGLPVVVALNMLDVAERRGFSIDVDELSRRLGAPVAACTASKGKGREALRAALAETTAAHPKQQAPSTFPQVDYGPLEAPLQTLIRRLGDAPALSCPPRWLALKLLEGDEEAHKLARAALPDAVTLLAEAEGLCADVEAKTGQSPEQIAAIQRHKTATAIAAACVRRDGAPQKNLTDRLDAFVCHRFMGPAILVGVLFALYHLSIVQGYKLTEMTWPLLAWLRETLAQALPAPGFLHEPLVRALSLWFMDSLNTLLNYIPIFFILFALIAVLEDSGYMPRMAFLLDRIFRRFGLHGQSTLPLILGGVYVGGCAIPGVMACRAIPDERARLATILVVPLMNCLAKVPLYVLLVGAYFPAHKDVAMFFIATVTILVALPMAKLLSLTVLRNRESAPFIMELPPYHLPTLSVVLRRAVERVWLFIKRIVTIVAAVAVVVFVLMRFPGLPGDRLEHFETRAGELQSSFLASLAGTPLEGTVGANDLTDLVNFSEAYRSARMAAATREQVETVNASFAAQNPAFFAFVMPLDPESRAAARNLTTLVRDRRTLLHEMRAERLDSSFLGRLGRTLEPVTQFAGFNWRINISLLAAFAAKESTVATLGALYEQGAEGGQALDERMREQETGFTALHALALMLFMATYPPCIAASMMVKVQAGETKWMLLAMGYPILLGFGFACLVFTGGGVLGLNGLQAMGAFYALALGATLAMALVNPDRFKRSA
jgi:ferrous iron transport protein B